jgi:two-component system chemotaxis response regulator CheV
VTVREARRLVEFRIGPARAALSLPIVREVIARPVIVPVPGSHPHVAGVVMSRGVAVPVYDLRRHSPLWDAGEPRPVTGEGAAAEEPTNLIVCVWSELLLGLLAGPVDLLDEAETAPEAAPGSAAVGGDCVRELLRGGDGVVALLDPSRLFPSLGVPQEGEGSGRQGGGR